MIHRAAAWCILAALAAQQRPSRPRWTALEGIRLGGSVDDILALNGECHPVLDVEGPAGFYTAPRVAEFAFGRSLPHQDTNTAAIRAALRDATVCRVPVLEGRATSYVVAIGRIVVGATIYFTGDSAGRPLPDSVRRVVWRAWGRPTAPAAALDSWLAPRYRSYILVQSGPRRMAVQPPVEAIMVDVAACTAFDRRVHRASGRGAPEAC